MRSLVATALLTIGGVAHGSDPPSFGWMRAVELPELTSVSLVAVPLDSHVYEFTRVDRPDLRLRWENGENVGFLLRAAAESQARSIRQFWAAQQVSAHVDEAQGLQVVVALREKDPEPQGVRIITPLTDFEHRVRVESSADGQNWSSAGEPTVIFDYSRYVDARHDTVPFRAEENWRFRVTIDDITAEQESLLLELKRRLRGGQEHEQIERSAVLRRPFRIDRIDFYRDDSQVETGKRHVTAYPSTNFLSKVDDKQHQTMLTFATRREPITEIKLLTAAANFSRTARVEAEVADENSRSEWKNVAQGTVTRFAVGAIHREDVTLTIPEQSTSRYRVIIENRDSPPLEITGVELFGPQYEVTFLAAPGQKLTLEYGSPDAPAGRFDTAALQAALAQDQPVLTATLEEPRANPGAGPARWKPWNDRRVLFGAILALTALLGWGLFRAGRNITAPPDA